MDRAIIHFFSSAGILLLGYVVLHYVQRRKQWAWLPSMTQPQLILVAVVIFAVAAMREAWDVSAGQSVAKAVSDYASWFLGCGCSVWGLWRFRSM